MAKVVSTEAAVSNASNAINSLATAAIANHNKEVVGLFAQRIADAKQIEDKDLKKHTVGVLTELQAEVKALLAAA